MLDAGTSCNNTNTENADQVLQKYNSALELEMLSSLAIYVVKINQYMGHQTFEYVGELARKVVGDLVYYCKLEDIGTDEEAKEGGFDVIYGMVKDSSITFLPEKVKVTYHLSNKKLIATITDGEVYVAEDSISPIISGVMYELKVYGDDETCGVEATEIKVGGLDRE